MRITVLVLSILCLQGASIASESLRKGLVYLQQVESRLRQNPEDIPLRLARLRSYYFIAVAEYDSLPGAWQRHSELKGVLPPDLDSAYAGALHVVEAKHELWPPHKLDALKKAQPLLDKAVERSPHQTEIRYLRLMSCYYLPFFFGRQWSVRNDFAALAKLLPQTAKLYPPGLVAEIAEFVLDKAPDLAPPGRQALLATLEQAKRERIAASMP